MPDAFIFDYAIIRVVPRVERGEFFNAGVILFCATQEFLGAKTELDTGRLKALAPQLDERVVEEHLATISHICEGAGPIGQMSRRERFHWLAAPRSTIIQVSPVHSGRCDDLEAALGRLFVAMVRRVEMEDCEDEKGA